MWLRRRLLFGNTMQVHAMLLSVTAAVRGGSDDIRRLHRRSTTLLRRRFVLSGACYIMTSSFSQSDTPRAFTQYHLGGLCDGVAAQHPSVGGADVN